MRWSPEWWAYWAGILAVVFTVGAALLGLVVWYFSNEASRLSNERTASLESKVSDQQERTANAQRDAAEANRLAAALQLDIAKANERAARANEIAEKERLARLQLEARLADRVITPSQKTRLVTALAPIKGGTVDLTVFGDSPDITKVSGAILESLTSAGILVNSSRPFGGDMNVRGVAFGLSKDASQAIGEAVASVIAILKETLGGGVGLAPFDQMAGLFSGMSGGSPGALPTGQAAVRIWIGPKP